MILTKQEEVERNYLAFQELLPQIIRAHRGQHALMRDGQVVEYFDTFRDARVAGRRLFDDGRYSIQEVTDVPVYLGWWSHGVH